MTRNSPGDLQIQQPHHLDIFDELGGQLGEVDLVNIHLLLFDQVEEQIQRPFKDFKFDFIFGHVEYPNARTPLRGLATLDWNWQ